MTSKILIITSEYYGAPTKIGAHRFSDQLAKRNYEVTIISFPISPLYKLVSKKTGYVERNANANQIIEVRNNLRTLVPKVLIPPLMQICKFFPYYTELWFRWNSTVSNFLKQSKFDIAICESPLLQGIFKRTKASTKIIRVPDNFEGFWGSSAQLSQLIESFYSMAETIISPSQQLISKYQKIYPDKQVFQVPNGVDESLFDEPRTTKDNSYRKEGPTAIYIGSLSKWFDFRLLYETAERRPEWTFLIIGKLESTHSSPPPNVNFLGAMPIELATRYLVNANCGLIPFDVRNHESLVNYVNPIKLYEYMAYGLPVIATRWKELELLESPAILIDNADELCRALDDCERCDKSEELVAFARQFTWQHITTNLLAKIETPDDTFKICSDTDR